MIGTDELKALLEKATPAPWTGHNMTHAEGRAMTPEEIGEYVCNSVKMGEEGRFLFVSGKHADGGDCDVCHTGNGPRGAANTALIALAPTIAARVVALEEVSDALENLLIAIGMGWDLDGVVDVAKQALEKSGSELFSDDQAARAEC